MTAVSSFRPFDQDPSGEFTRNQLAAFQSWDKAFERIFFLNGFEPALDSHKTVFIPAEAYPPIIQLIEVAATQPGWSALINADIVISPHLPIVEAKLKARKATCAASWRWTFDPAAGIKDAKVTDFGGDFFAAKQEVWARAYEMVDSRLRIGAQTWDAYMLSFFATFCTQGFYDITPSRTVFHPIHFSRRLGPCVNPNEIMTYGFATMPASRIT